MISANSEGLGELELKGLWRRPVTAGLLGRSGCQVEIRLCHAYSGISISAALHWTTAQTESDGTWSAKLDSIPCGGPYRLETRLNPKGNKTKEWAWRGDQIAWLSVGDAYIIAGQSNASGYGAPPFPDEPEIGIHLFGQDGQWKLASHPLHDGSNTRYLAALQPFVPGHSGFLEFAKVLRRVTGRPIALIPCALGGSALKAWEAQGELCQNMFTMVKDAQVKPKAILFVQGESDAKGRDSETYGHRVKAAIQNWRQGLDIPEIPILSVQLGRYFSKNPGEDDEAWSLVREAQRQATEEIPHYHVIPALDIPLCDTIHYSAIGNLALGDRLARLALQSLYGQSIAAHAPHLRSAHFTQLQRLELEFDDVSDRLDNLDPTKFPFQVQDDAGVVPIFRIIYPMDHRIELHLSREVKGKVFISAGIGENPPTLPIDVDRRIPILAFHRFACS